MKASCSICGKRVGTYLDPAGARRLHRHFAAGRLCYGAHAEAITGSVRIASTDAPSLDHEDGCALAATVPDHVPPCRDSAGADLTIPF